MDIFDKFENGLVTLDDQEEVLKHSYAAYLFACRIQGADIEKCQEAVLKRPVCAFYFAKDIPGANIDKCLESVCKHPKLIYWFARYVKGVDINRCLEMCSGTEYEDVMNRYLMERALE